MRYGIKVYINGEDIYKKLSSSDKLKFEEVQIVDAKVDLVNNELEIMGFAIERKDCDVDEYLTLKAEEKDASIIGNLNEITRMHLTL